MKARKVRCIDTGEIFKSVTEAGKKYNRHYNCITNCCTGRSKTAAGLRWEWCDDKPNAGAAASLCWKCYRSVHWVDDPTPCTWAMRFEPVEGWEAEETMLGGDHKNVLSYKVIKCPLFEPDRWRGES